MIVEKVACDPPLPRLPRHPFLGSPKWNPSGIPVAVVCDHGAVVSTSFPSSDAGWGPRPSGGRLLRAPPPPDEAPVRINLAPRHQSKASGPPCRLTPTKVM